MGHFFAIYKCDCEEQVRLISNTRLLVSGVNQDKLYLINPYETKVSETIRIFCVHCGEKTRNDLNIIEKNLSCFGRCGRKIKFFFYPPRIEIRTKVRTRVVSKDEDLVIETKNLLMTHGVYVCDNCFRKRYPNPGPGLEKIMEFKKF